MNKQELEKELEKVWDEIEKTKRISKEDLKKREKEEYEPIVKQANDIKYAIDKEIREKYKDTFSPLLEKERELKIAIQNCNLESAKTLWYPHGSKVTLWKKENWSDKWGKTKDTGVVQIYDGTQETSATLSTYRLPKIGDVCVFYTKKDGTMGKQFDQITSYGKIKWHPVWLIEGDTPENNIETRMQKEE